MRAITEGGQTLDAFLARVSAQLQQLVDQGRALGRIAVPAASSPPPQARAAARPQRSGTPTRKNSTPKNGKRTPS